MHPVDIKSDTATRVRRPPLPAGNDRQWAWFLDVDGTLLEIETRPDLVLADPRLLRLLQRLHQAYDGAVALVSGRSLLQLEAIFNPLALPAGASHGLELKLPDGSVRRAGHAVPAHYAERISAFAQRHNGLIFEQKPLSIGVHYRDRPELLQQLLALMEPACAELGAGFRLMHGKMVLELLPTAADKGRAIESFMELPPFAGRRPVFVGDDLTDEDGFAVVNALGGLSVRVGHAASSAARWQLSNVSDVRAWLRAAVAAPNGTTAKGRAIE